MKHHNKKIAVILCFALSFFVPFLVVRIIGLGTTFTFSWWLEHLIVLTISLLFLLPAIMILLPNYKAQKKSWLFLLGLGYYMIITVMMELLRS